MAPDDVKSSRLARLAGLTGEIADEANPKQQQNQDLATKPLREAQQNGLERPVKYGACDLAGNQSGKFNTFSSRELNRFDGANQHAEGGGGGDQLVAAAAALGQRRPSSGGGGSLSSSSHESDDDSLKPKPALVERLAKIVPCFGILLALCASVFLGTAGMLVKLTTSVHGIQVAVFRAMIQMFIYAVIISIRGSGWLPPRRELVPVGLRALLGGASITFSYYALKLIPLGDATTIRFSLPIWTLIMSYFFLSESCSLFKVSAVFISVAGVVLIAKPDESVYFFHLLLNALRLESDRQFQTNEVDYENNHIEELAFMVESRGPAPALQVATNPATGSLGQLNSSDELNVLLASGGANHSPPLINVAAINADTLRQFEGCMMALASSICLSLSLIALRLCKKTPAEITISWLSLFSVLIGTITLLLLNEWRLPDNLPDCAFIALNGMCGAAGQWFITSALKVEQSGIIALARTFDIEIAFLYSALLLDEEIRVTSIVGSVLVSLGVIIVVVPKWFNSANSAAGEPEQRLTGNESDSERRNSPETTPTTSSTTPSSSISILDRSICERENSPAALVSLECSANEHERENPNRPNQPARPGE